ncbi:MAG TPA: PPOX class F420-dependent oxidoreductase [Acidimicrobiaceae bacterium]|nr:PPOX class F420-dependent oxidoreductase [Acidimicrobiaceae bacterium]
MDAATIARERHISLTSFKRDGTPVSTPVWCAKENGSLLVFSEANSWKVKRIRHDPHVQIAPSSARGSPHGPAVDGDALILEDTAEVETLLARKYGWMWPACNRLTVLTRRLRRQSPPKSVTIKITLR